MKPSYAPLVHLWPDRETLLALRLPANPSTGDHVAAGLAKAKIRRLRGLRKRERRLGGRP